MRINEKCEMTKSEAINNKGDVGNEKCETRYGNRKTKLESEREIRTEK